MLASWAVAIERNANPRCDGALPRARTLSAALSATPGLLDPTSPVRSAWQPVVKLPKMLTSLGDRSWSVVGGEAPDEVRCAAMQSRGHEI
jgi:hypothetical protein